MQEIGIKNFRSIEDSKKIELKPITAIVGRNSSGKSSFIRLFPLLKQTMEKRISDAILWYGDYVDFGDYEHAISKRNKGDAIELFLSLTVNPNNFYFFDILSDNKPLRTEVTIKIHKEYIENILITIDEQKIDVDLLKDQKISKITINGEENIIDVANLVWHRDTKGILPLLLEQEEDEKNYYRRVISSKAVEKAMKLIYGTQGHNNESEFAYNSPFFAGNKEDLLIHYRNSKNEKVAKKFLKYKVTSKKFIEINNYLVASSVGSIFEAINRVLISELTNTNYVKPIRAMVDRYYRVQGVNIEELDSDGSNLPMILYNMKAKDLKKFEAWSKETLGVIFSVEDTEGHVSLVIKDTVDSVEKTNLADTGYGYSQMLPIVVLLWMIHNKYGRNGYMEKTKMVIIEQPELHLHPAYQAKMIDVFVNIVKEAKKQGIDLKIIFETHSEAMINRLGKLINAQKLDQEWVKILFFDKDSEITKITSKEFNEKGLITGWPIGFFAPDEVE